MNPYLRAFLGGFVATLVAHQGMLWLLHVTAGAPAPFDLSPTPPLGVPRVLSLAFWGGVWGVAIWPLLRHRSGAAYWLRAAVVGAIGPSLVALAIVLPLKGGAFMAGFDPRIIVGALLLNAAWGLGLAAFMRMTART